MIALPRARMATRVEGRPSQPVRLARRRPHCLARDARTLERLCPSVTVAGEPRVNPNTASHEVLAAWLGDPSRADDLVARRTSSLVPCDDLPPCTTRAQHYRVQVTARVGRVRRRVEAIVWAVGSVPRVT